MNLLVKNKLSNKIYYNKYNTNSTIESYIFSTSKELRKDIQDYGLDCFIIKVLDKDLDLTSDYKLDDIKPRYYGYVDGKYYSVTNPSKIPGKVYKDREELFQDIAQA